MKEYSDLDATALAELVAKGEVSPAELVDQAIDAVSEVEPTLNAVVHRMYDEARAAAKGELPDGPFKGVPFVFKDLDGFLADHPYTMGSRFLQGFVPDHDATVIARMKATGVVPIAKTACPELGILGTTEAEVWGPTRNPWNTQHSPGGSSGGTAALVSARAVPMGHGGDGGGSIRIPSSCCGLFGLKPTRGRNPLGPDLGEGWGGYVQPGVLTRSVRDCARMLDATAGPAPGDPYHAPPQARPFAEEVGADPGTLRIAYSTGSLFGKTTHPDVQSAVEDAAKLLEALGHEVVEDEPRIDRDALVEAYVVQLAAGVAVEIDDAARWTGTTATPAGFEPSTWFLAQLGRRYSAADLTRMRDTCHAASRLMARFHEDYDLFLNSVLAYPPAEIGESTLKPSERVSLAVLRTLPIRKAMDLVAAELADQSFERTANTMLFNMTGQPCMSVPLYWSDSGLPVGVQLVAPFGDEATLFRVAAQLEQARPWAERTPSVCYRS